MADLNSPKRPFKTYIAAGFGFIILLGILGSNLTQTAVQGVSTSASPTPTVATVESTSTLSNTTVTPQSSLKPSTTVVPTATPTNQPPTVKPTVFVPTATPTTVPASSLSNDNSYTNVDGNQIHSPAASSNGVPPGASARCGDGEYSFSQNRRGTCSGHGGVAQWL